MQHLGTTSAPPVPLAMAPPAGFWGLMSVLGRRKRLLIFLPSFAAIAVALYLKQAVIPQYAGVATLLPPPYNEKTVNGNQSMLGGDSQVGNAALSLKSPSDLYAGILFSGTIGQAIIKRFKLQAQYKSKNMPDAIKTLQGRTHVSVGKDGIIAIEVLDPSPEQAANLANAYVDELYAFSRSLAMHESERRSEFYEKVNDNVRKKLSEAEDALQVVEKRTGYTRLNGQDAAMLASITEIEQSIAMKEARLKAVGTYATDLHPEVINLKAEIKALKEQQLKLRTASQTIANPRGTPQPGYGDLSNTLREHNRRKREVEYWENILSITGKFNELSKVDVSRDLGLIQVLDRAEPSPYKASPKIGLSATLTGIFVFLLCLTHVLFQDWKLRMKHNAPDLVEIMREARTSWYPSWIRQWLLRRKKRKEVKAALRRQVIHLRQVRKDQARQEKLEAKANKKAVKLAARNDPQASGWRAWLNWGFSSPRAFTASQPEEPQ